MKKLIILALITILFQGCSSDPNYNIDNTVKRVTSQKPVYSKQQKIKKRISRVSCKNFSSQAHAQKYFDTKKHGWKGLDRDKDGRAL